MKLRQSAEEESGSQTRETRTYALSQETASSEVLTTDEASRAVGVHPSALHKLTVPPPEMVALAPVPQAFALAHSINGFSKAEDSGNEAVQSRGRKAREHRLGLRRKVKPSAGMARVSASVSRCDRTRFVAWQT